jgi:NADPH:quinone reductase-like Zn-dependent oxidoreductase
VPVPEGVAAHDAACAAITFSTVEHMLFDNARLEPGETILIQSGGSGIGTVAVKQAKALGCTVIATAGSDDKCERMRELGADHVVNYNTDRFESALPQGDGQARGGRGVRARRRRHLGRQPAIAADGRASGHVRLHQRHGGRNQPDDALPAAAPHHGSFGASMRNVADGLAKMAGGMAPVLDSVLPLEGFEDALRRLESRRVFGKIVVTL